MNMLIKTQKKEIEIGFESVMQFCGQNVIEKKKVIDTIIKYFSNAKYHSYEENERCRIFIDAEEIGRKSYTIFHISSKKDLLMAISLSKNTLMSSHIRQLLTGLDFQNHLEKIDDELLSIFNALNTEIHKLGSVSLSYSLANLWDMIQNSSIEDAGNDYLENKSCFELIELYLNLLGQIQAKTPERIMVIIENTDHMLQMDEYRKVVEKCIALSEQYLIHVIFCTSLQGYIVLNREIDVGVTIFNELIYTLPTLDRIEKFINEGYPYYKVLSEVELIDSLENIIHEIGKNNCFWEVQENVILKMMNQTLALPQKLKKKPNELEIQFLLYE